MKSAPMVSNLDTDVCPAGNLVKDQLLVDTVISHRQAQAAKHVCTCFHFISFHLPLSDGNGKSRRLEFRIYQLKASDNCIHRHSSLAANG